MKTVTLLGALCAVGALGCGSSESPAASHAPANGLLDPPAKTQGFQLEAAPFEVPAGTEQQMCFFAEVPSDTDVYVNHITLAQEPGSHHLNVFRVNTIKDLDGKPGDVIANGPCFVSSNSSSTCKTASPATTFATSLSPKEWRTSSRRTSC